jgi:hypothetical protein
MTVDLLLWPTFRTSRAGEVMLPPTRLGPFSEVALHGSGVYASLADTPEVSYVCVRLMSTNGQWRLDPDIGDVVAQRQLFRDGLWHDCYRYWSVIPSDGVCDKPPIKQPKRRTVLVQE